MLRFGIDISINLNNYILQNGEFKQSHHGSLEVGENSTCRLHQHCTYMHLCALVCIQIDVCW
jgi:hypothetical protein